MRELKVPLTVIYQVYSYQVKDIQGRLVFSRSCYKVPYAHINVNIITHTYHSLIANTCTQCIFLMENETQLEKVCWDEEEGQGKRKVIVQLVTPNFLQKREQNSA